MIVRFRALRGARNGAIVASSVSWLDLDVWLTRSLLRYAARNFSIEKTVPRDSM